MLPVTAFYSTSVSIPQPLLISGFPLAKIDMMEGRKYFSLLFRKIKVKMKLSIKLPLRAMLSHEYKFANGEHMDITKS